MLQNFMTGLVPFLVLIILNLRVYIDIRNANMAVATAHSGSSDRERKESQLARVMMSYVVAFLFCNLPRLIVEMYNIANASDIIRCKDRVPAWVKYMGQISVMMLVINSSINIMIYTYMSTEFRRELRALFKASGNSPPTEEQSSGLRSARSATAMTNV